MSNVIQFPKKLNLKSIVDADPQLRALKRELLEEVRDSLEKELSPHSAELKIQYEVLKFLLWHHFDLANDRSP